VDHARGMHRDQGVGKPAGKLRQGGPPHRAALGDQVVEGAAGHKPGHDVGDFAGQVGVDHFCDVRAVHPLHRLDLAREPPPGSRIPCHAGAQNLEGHRPVSQVAGKVNNAHPALANPV